MSTTTQHDVFKAELVEPCQVNSDAINPFGSPENAADEALTVSAGIGRASREQVELVNRRLVQCEICYGIVWASFTVLSIVGLPLMIALGLETSGIDIILISDLAFWVWVVCNLIAWFVFARLINAIGDIDVTSGSMILLFPIPLIGFFIYFEGKRYASRFLMYNGYSPSFLGSKQDRSEIVAMNADLNYRPSCLSKFDGSKRRRVSTLSSVAVAFSVLLNAVGWALIRSYR